MRPWKRLFAVAALALPACVLADPVGYAVGFDHLYRIDLATGQATDVGAIGYSDVEGLAFGTDGVLYAVADAGASTGNTVTDVLLRVDPQSGAGLLVAPLGGLAGQGAPPFGNLDYGLAATCDGQLWLSSDTTGQLWEVNRFTAGTRLVGNLGVPLSGLANWGDALYGISVADDLGLYRIDTGSGDATRVGALQLPIDFYDAGLAFDADGQLWATIDYFNPPPPDDLPEVDRNDIARIDHDSGAGQIVAAVTGAGSGSATVQMEGLAIAGGAGCGVAPPPPPPPPSTASVPAGGPPALLLLGCMLAAVAATRLRRG